MWVCSEFLESGHRNSSRLLFNKLLPHVIYLKDKRRYREEYWIRGVKVCATSWFHYHGLSKDDSRVKSVLACLRKGDQEWVPKRGGKKRGRPDDRGSYAKTWLKDWLLNYADLMPTGNVCRYDPVEIIDLHKCYETDCEVS